MADNVYCANHIYNVNKNLQKQIRFRWVQLRGASASTDDASQLSSAVIYSLRGFPFTFRHASIASTKHGSKQWKHALGEIGVILASTRLITLRHFPRPLIGMEQFLCFFTEGAAEKFRIEGFDLRIAMTEAQGHFWSRA